MSASTLYGAWKGRAASAVLRKLAVGHDAKRVVVQTTAKHLSGKIEYASSIVQQSLNTVASSSLMQHIRLASSTG